MNKFFKWLVSLWNEYSELESNRLWNGYYCHTRLEPKINCPYCKTDWALNKNGIEYRCVYSEFVSEPVAVVEPKGIDSLFPDVLWQADDEPDSDFKTRVIKKYSPENIMRESVIDGIMEKLNPTLETGGITFESPMDNLKPCPYDKGAKCAMDEPCEGCETWARVKGVKYEKN